MTNNFSVQIGIHSAKFTNERSSKNVLSAVQRYNIMHPVVNDVTLRMWHDMGITCWPSLIMLGTKQYNLLAIFNSYIVYIYACENFCYRYICLNLFQDLVVNHWLFLWVKITKMKYYYTQK